MARSSGEGQSPLNGGHSFQKYPTAILAHILLSRERVPGHPLCDHRLPYLQPSQAWISFLKRVEDNAHPRLLLGGHLGGCVIFLKDVNCFCPSIIPIFASPIPLQLSYIPQQQVLSNSTKPMSSEACLGPLPVGSHRQLGFSKGEKSRQ